MILEQRIYDIDPAVPITDFLEPYERLGLPLQREILGGLVGYFVTEIGTQNQLNHFWAYSSLDDRQRRRDELARHPDWLACVAIIRPLITRWNNVIMRPTDFSPMRSLPVQPGPERSAFTVS